MSSSNKDALLTSRRSRAQGGDGGGDQVSRGILVREVGLNRRRATALGRDLGNKGLCRAA